MKLNHNFTDTKYFAGFVFLLLALFAITIWYFNEMPRGGADNFAHYWLSKNSFEKPSNLLNLWGKPVFTLINAPFAYFGFKAAQLTNVFFVLLTCLLSFLILNTLSKNKNNVLVMLFVMFSPMYLVLMTTVLTEIVFSFILLCSILSFFRKNYVASSLIISLLPFARTEGIVIIPIFILAFALKKKHLSILMLPAATLIICIIGAFVYGDILWLIHRFPYRGAENIYGSGSLLHFTENFYLIAGIPVTLFFVLGLITKIKELFQPISNEKQVSYEFLLIILPLFAYFGAHSIAWFLGAGGSLGLLRVMGAVLPLVAIVSFWGFNQVLKTIKKRNLNLIVIFVVLLWIIIEPFRLYTIPMKWGELEKTIMRSADWLNGSNYKTNDVHFFHPQYYEFLKGQEGRSNNQIWCKNNSIPEKMINEGDLLIWDSQFGPNEGGLSKQAAISNNNLELINIFKPETDLKLYNNKRFEILVFRYQKNIHTDNFRKLMDILGNPEFTGELIFEKKIFPQSKANVLVSDTMKKFQNEFILGYDKELTDLTKNFINLGFVFNTVLSCNECADLNKIFLVTELLNDNKLVRYTSVKMENSLQPENSEFRWLNLHLNVNTREVDCNRLKVYIWNPGQESIILKKMDLKIYDRNSKNNLKSS